MHACCALCTRRYGAFVRPDKIKVGDYSVIDEFASDNELGSGDEI